MAHLLDVHNPSRDNEFQFGLRYLSKIYTQGFIINGKLH